MGYEPLLVIKKNDLEKKRSLIEESEFKTYKKEELEKAWAELRIALNSGVINFKELSIVLTRPEGTNNNCVVRNLLLKLKIEFKEHV